jgi:nucleotide-binding universal stress UspA family protein
MTSAIVVGYIPTPGGEAALSRAIEEAATHKAKLLVVNSSRGDAYIDDRRVQDYDLGALKECLAGAGVEYQLVQPERGHDAAESILDVCEGHGADLIVIGLRRRSAVGKLLLGSTAQRVLLHADVAVLAVRAHS